MFLVVVSSGLTPSYPPSEPLGSETSHGSWFPPALPLPSASGASLLRLVSGRLLQAVGFPRKVEVDSAGIEPPTSQRHRGDLPLSHGCWLGNGSRQ